MKAVVALSGGLDSTTLLAQIIKDGIEPKDIMTIFFDYGSKHNLEEFISFKKVTSHYKVATTSIELWKVFDNIKSALLIGSPDPLPEGHYESQSMKQTVVPCRNLIFISIMGGIADSIGAKTVYVGVHAGDHFIYPDCRPMFISNAGYALANATEQRVILRAPFLYINKAEILKMGLAMKVPYHLTRTCYSSDNVACGKCGSCQERLEAFELNGFADPINYTTREILPKESK